MALGKDFLKEFSEGLRDQMKLDILSGLAQGTSNVISSLPQTAFGFGTSYLKSLMGDYFSRKSLDYQAQLNEQSAVNAYNRQLDFWKQQNAYNDPSSQMRRLQQAGLNPALINANGVNNVAGGLSSVPSASPGSPDHSKPDPMSDAEAVIGMAHTIKEMGFLDEQMKTEVQKRLNLIVERGLKDVDRELRIEERDLARLNKIETFEALYGTSLDGGAPTISNNRITEIIRESRSRVSLNESQTALHNASKELAEAQLNYAKNRESREAEQHVADLALKTAQQVAAYAQASYASQQAKYTFDMNSREAEQHSMNLAIDELRKSSVLSDSEINALKARVEQAWTEGVFGPDAKGRRWENFEYIVNDFFHNNLNLSGSGSVSKSSH